MSLSCGGYPGAAAFGAVVCPHRPACRALCCAPSSTVAWLLRRAGGALPLVLLVALIRLGPACRRAAGQLRQPCGGARFGPAAAIAVLPAHPESETMISWDYLAVSDRQDGGTLIMQLRGELDLCSRDVLRAAVSRASLARPRTLVLDLSALEFIDCSGLSVLIWARNLLATDGAQLVISDCSPAVRRLIALTGAGEYLNLSQGGFAARSAPAADQAASRAGLAAAAGEPRGGDGCYGESSSPSPHELAGQTPAGSS